MGKLQSTIDFLNKTLTLDWSGLDDTQLYWVGRSQGYPLQIPNPDTGEMMDNPIPIVPWVLNKRLQELSDAAMIQYKAETPDPRDAAAQVIGDFTPNEAN